ncbi:hypothetical protein Pyn_02459 [Prunus yedoensis var. nudiflora]|uniref:Uncharacterized protein n=1 Tax=Prunus yedoensis var. nudiflora TaxID=2094558 RepID=A0A314YMP8_PRUYE|nr:hypothetical protein Pyn_02459 [Prunus yedoensis var. nudiflora]
MFASPSSSGATLLPDAEAGGGTQGDSGEAVPRAELATEEVPEERVDAWLTCPPLFAYDTFY